MRRLPEDQLQRWRALGNDSAGEKALLDFYDAVRRRDLGLRRVDLDAALGALWGASVRLRMTRWDDEGRDAQRADLERRRRSNRAHYAKVLKLARALLAFRQRHESDGGVRWDWALPEESGFRAHELLKALLNEHEHLDLEPEIERGAEGLYLGPLIRRPRAGHPEAPIKAEARKMLKQAHVPDYWIASLLVAIGFRPTQG